MVEEVAIEESELTELQGFRKFLFEEYFVKVNYKKRLIILKIIIEIMIDPDICNNQRIF